MKKLITAIALALACSTAAYVQAATPAEKPGCCEKMKADGRDCCCCEDMEKGEDGHAAHETHDMKGAHTPDTPHQH
ncbi:MAG: hypothetical protein BGP16_07415 [Sphingobium sp. 66-54]|nr:MAG: hypothetical protein BGP16_07415 [Sphingobium sp. 66-54]